MQSALDLYLRDLYPSKGTVETSTQAVPDPSDQDALGEDETTAEKASTEYAGKKGIILALIVLFCLIVFFGIN